MTKTHLDLIRSLPCAVCGRPPPNEGHHLLRLYGVSDEEKHGTGKRTADRWAIPLCPPDHRGLHADGNETKYLAGLKVSDPQSLAKMLWECADGPAAIGILEEWGGYQV